MLLKKKKDMMPLRKVDKDCFRNMIKVLEVRYRLPGGKDLYYYLISDFKLFKYIG